MYIFVIKNTQDTYETLSLRVKSETFNPGDVDLTKTYQNDVSYNEFVTYEINPTSNAKIQPFIQELVIKLTTVTGDADLFVSFDNSNPDKDNFDYRSRRINHIDQVTILEQG